MKISEIRQDKNDMSSPSTVICFKIIQKLTFFQICEV